MKKLSCGIFIIFIQFFGAIFLIAPLPMLAQTNSLEPLEISEGLQLEQLRKEIANKPIYDQKKAEKIEKIKDRLSLNNITTQQKSDVYNQLTDEYKNFIIDSAIYYAELNIDIARKSENLQLLTSTQLDLSMLYANSGYFIESKQILDNIDTSKLDTLDLIKFYEAGSLFYRNYGYSNNREAFIQKGEIYKDSILSLLESDSPKYKIVLAHKLINGDDLNLLEETVFELDKIKDENREDYGLLTYLVAKLYEKLGNTEKMNEYLTKSAIWDIKNSIKENASISALAFSLFQNETKNVDLVYLFAKAGLDDAIFCNVNFRTLGTTAQYEIISTNYKEKIEREKKTQKILLIIIISLFIIICIILFYVYKQMKRLSALRKKIKNTNNELQKLNVSISNMNNDLQKSNKQLHQANITREEYIRYFFDLCSSYIEQFGDYRKSMYRLVKSNKLDDLLKEIKSSKIEERNYEELYHTFDMVFLKLYPTFVEKFNNLLKPEEKIILKSNELLNTDLRIFALIKLGIDDSKNIAKFLRYSLSTIYNYRTKMRNRAVGNRDKFEEYVINIE